MEKKFPQYLHRPVQVLWFESDELGMLLMLFVLALSFGHIFYLLAVVGTYAYCKAKTNYPRGFFRHVLYFAGIIKIKGYPTYFEKEFLE